MRSTSCTIVIIEIRHVDILKTYVANELSILPLLDVLRLDRTVTFRVYLVSERTYDYVLKKDGEDTIVQCEFSVIQRESGFISGLVCVLTDVTEQEKIDRERRNFVSNVSHELRTPLTSIKSYTEALVDGAWENKEIAPEFLNVIETGNRPYDAYDYGLLNLSRMDQNRLELDKEFVNMNELVKHIANRFDMVLSSDQYREKNYRILTDITQRDLWVKLTKIR